MISPCRLVARGKLIAMPAFKATFTGAAIATLVLVAVNQRALWPLEVAALKQPYEAPAPKSDRLDGLVKLREAMMRAASRPRPEAPEPPLQQVTLGSMSGAASDPSLISAPKVGDDSVETKLVALDHPDAAQPVPTTRDAFGDASNPAPAAQDFRYLIYNVWSELPPAEKPAEIVLRSLKDIPVGTPVEEIKRASDAFGLDFNFMKAVAKIESGFDPNQRTGSYIGLFQLSEYEFRKFGAGQIRSPRDNAVAAAYKVITEGILFEWVTHRKPTLSDLYLIHQQGWEGAAEHISQPDRIAWKSMCATSEGREKGEKWCRRAIWANTLPAVKQTWKTVDKLTSGAFVGMWQARVAEFYSKYMATAAAGEAKQ
ncbi:transglycosylase [Bradyrhizobium australiense]|uniref:transglycosylase n=1 Tax=Bradyrhizobium australiense TaxID=2721161 RepID=UPI001F2B2B52|nr:transglycosylase [Bradyrhizobium australiense]